jgi:RNA polymerase sigma factor (sigma-70 family)
MSGAGVIPAKMEFVARTEGSGQSRATVVPFPSEILSITTAAAKGHEDAAREFFQRYCDLLFRYLLVVSRGREDHAREILSIAMIKAARTIRPMQTDADVWRWLTRIALNAFIDDCRKNKRRISTDELPAILPAPEPDQSLTDALNESLQELPLEEREILEQYYFEEQSQAALAEAANTSRKAVESHLARIRQKLRAAILKKLS